VSTFITITVALEDF